MKRSTMMSLMLVMCVIAMLVAFALPAHAEDPDAVWREAVRAVITTGGVVDAAIDTDHLAADAVTGAKLADDAVDSEHIADGAVDLAHMSAESVDSDQYVDGSIDTAHIADDQVTAAKCGAIMQVNAGDIADTTAYTPDFAGQLLIETSNSDGTNNVWTAAGTTTNDWTSLL